MQAIGDKISSRSGHSAVLTLNGTIIIYGGTTTANFTQADPILATLDTTVDPMRWISPHNSSTRNAPPSLGYHSATLYNDFMIIAFGHLPNRPIKLNNRIYIYDVLNNKWVTTMDRSSSNPIDNGLIIAISVITGIFIIAVTLGFLIYRKYKKAKMELNYWSL
ncbi:18078_t:CDS:2 [Gigaspora margarita]|uniref:18078_t:CDS:1 n=1 Tax=Gigaspora margarita TaxID=4874 RepID=A0ABN7UBZ3_GIGMA|nr:18078_t:CDS:2 [Gigaspora margarita]